MNEKKSQEEEPKV